MIARGSSQPTRGFLVSDLDVALDRPLPRAIIAGRESFWVFCAGTCFRRAAAPLPASSSLAGDGRAASGRMRSRKCLATTTGIRARPRIQAPRISQWILGDDPDRAAPAPAREVRRDREASSGAGRARAPHSARSTAVFRSEPPQAPLVPPPQGRPLIAICMATFDPDPELFRTQVGRSARRRTRTGSAWSATTARARALQAMGGRRRATTRFVRRALRAARLLPEFRAGPEDGARQAELVALCDQDDAGIPTSSRRCGRRSATPSSSTATCGWSTRRARSSRRRSGGPAQQPHQPASLLITNTIAGAACLFRRRGARSGAAFPEGPGGSSTTTGSRSSPWRRRLAYVDRPLYDYVQHPGAVLGRVVTEAPQRGQGGAAGARLSARRGALGRWRSAYLRRPAPARSSGARLAGALRSRSSRSRSAAPLSCDDVRLDLADRLRLAPCAPLASARRPQRDAGASSGSWCAPPPGGAYQVLRGCFFA